MLLIQKPAEAPKKENVKLALDGKIVQEIQAYCAKANVTIEQFFEQAALYIFKRDRVWNEWKKGQSLSKNS